MPFYILIDCIFVIFLYLGNWIADLTEQTKGEMDLIMAVEEALAVLTIPDKQVLVESKVCVFVFCLQGDQYGLALFFLQTILNNSFTLSQMKLHLVFGFEPIHIDHPVPS